MPSKSFPDVQRCRFRFLFTGDELASPYPADEIPLVFTGAMDYWPNVDAVKWFAEEILPKLLPRWPSLRFYIVSRSPTPAVQNLPPSGGCYWDSARCAALLGGMRLS